MNSNKNSNDSDDPSNGWQKLFEHLQAQLKESQQSCAQLSTEVAASRSENQQYRQEVASLRQEVALLLQTVAQNNAETTAVRADCAQLSLALERLSQILNRLH